MCTVSCAKYLLIVFNCLFWFGGCALLVAGITLKVHPTVLNYQNIIEISGSDPLVLYAAVIFIVVGAVAFVVGFFGCCGALKEQRAFLLAYALLLVVVMIVEVAAAVLVVIYRTKVEQILKTQVIHKLKHDYAPGTATQKTMDMLQSKEQCCGVIDFTDYVNSRWQNTSKEFVPVSCCAKDYDDTTMKMKVKDESRCQQDARQHISDSEYFNSQGCYVKVETWIYQQTTVMLILAATIVVLEMVGLIAACCLRDVLKDISSKEE